MCAGGEYVVEKDVEDYLDHLHMLSTDNPQVVQMQHIMLNSDLFDDDGDVSVDLPLSGGADASYCGEPGCGRNYPHSHVAGGGEGGIGKSLLSGHDEVGGDVFEKDHFLKL